MSTTAVATNHILVDYDTYDSIYYILYFIGRYLVVFTSYFLCVIASLYATGTLVILEATNFFCPLYTLEEIRQYNFENGNEQGSLYDLCYSIDRQDLDVNVLTDINNNVFTGKIQSSDSIDFGSYLQAILYSLIAIILFIATLYQSYFLIYDTIFAIGNCKYKLENTRIVDQLEKLERKSQKKSQNTDQKDSTTNKNVESNKSDTGDKQTRDRSLNLLCCCCISLWKWYIFCMRKYMKWYFRYILPVYYIGSKWRILSVIAREWFEIGIQIYALLLFGGINIFNLNSIVLSQTPAIIKSFAVIVSLNCVFGMLFQTVFCCLSVY